MQDKVWVTGPGREPWEVYVVKGDAETFGASETATAGGEACCASAEPSLGPGRAAAEAAPSCACA